MTTQPTDPSFKPISSQLIPSGGRIDVREFMRMLNRRKWQLIGIVALVCALVGLVVAQITPEYRATALVMLDTRKAKVTNTADVLSGMATDLPAIQTEIEVLRSASLLGRVVDKLRLDQDPEYGAAQPNALTLLGREIRARYDSLFDPDRGSASNPSVAEGPRARAIAALQRNLAIAPRGRSYVSSARACSMRGWLSP